MAEPACLICGKKLVYTESYVTRECAVCGNFFSDNSSCEDGHFICDMCHGAASISVIRAICGGSVSKSPYEIALEIMKSPAVHMHGPEHHVIVGAALITAYKNAGGEIDFKRALNTVEERGKKVPGGICGNWGCCGAAVGAGIFLSVATKASPLSVESWGLCNLLTSECLRKISESGGPRCCKRNLRLAIETAVDFVGERLLVKMDEPGGKCGFSARNGECIENRCPYYPSGNVREEK